MLYIIQLVGNMCKLVYRYIGVIMCFEIVVLYNFLFVDVYNFFFFVVVKNILLRILFLYFDNEKLRL